MSTRKEFIAAAASVPLVAAAPPSPHPAPPTPSPKPKKQASQTAKALAAQMRAFDKNLTHKEIDTIAAGIDGNLAIGQTINPHGTALKNWDEPVTTFEVQS